MHNTRGSLAALTAKCFTNNILELALQSTSTERLEWTIVKCGLSFDNARQVSIHNRKMSVAPLGSKVIC
jgi:hypothetical protein